MRVRSSARSGAASLLCLLLPLHQGFAAEPPALDQVVMSTAGMGWLGFRATTEADGSVALDLPAGQLDDALKSLTVLPTESGSDGFRLRQVSIGGSSVLADPFQDTPLSPGDLAGLTALLERLRGSEIAVDTDYAEDPVTGRIVAVERRAEGQDGTVVERPWLVLSSSDGLVSVELGDVEAIRLEDEAAQRALDRVLERSVQARSDERRTLTIHTNAAQGTTLGLGLLVSTPVWKPSWRLLLQDGGARLQGWAVVENRSGQDWDDVRLTLVDGDATTLRQDLTRTWFRERPGVPVLPEEFVGQPLAMRKAAPPLAEPADMMMAEAFAPVAESDESESDLATSFTIEAPVEVADEGSLMVPLIDRTVSAARVALVPADGGGGAPEAAIRLGNDTGVSLPRGIVTVMDETAPVPTHLGDAVLPATPAGAERRLSFGQDRKIRYDLTEDARREVSELVVADGIATLRVAERYERRWRFQSEDDQPRLLEAQVRAEPGVEPVTPKDLQHEDGFWYVRGELPARGTATLALVTERPGEERLVLTDEDALDTVLATRGLPVPEAWQPKIDEISALAERRSAAEQDLAAVEEERAAIGAEQDRIRANLEAIAEPGPLRERWLNELGRQEDRLAELARQRDEAARARDEAVRQLRALAAELRR
ncbi:DUF4139 domain-containing protein [Geminicoccus flavidas]|uniref:DUF4139 domain-containing protein n=1 Tax=Geminicoccus flavidas TaxID=2506407 RepID=UPI00135AD20C|nr:DUF4139 domain-containing protein [Geminicoccus flavidas]